MSAATNRPVLFLDFDDVLCLNNPYGGYDVIGALAQVQKKTAAVGDFKEIWAQLFAREACSLLERINEEFAPFWGPLVFSAITGGSQTQH